MDEAELEIKLTKTVNRSEPLLGIQFEVYMHANILQMNDVIDCINSLQMSATTKNFHTSMNSRTGKKIMLFCTL